MCAGEARVEAQQVLCGVSVPGSAPETAQGPGDPGVPPEEGRGQGEGANSDSGNTCEQRLTYGKYSLWRSTAG